MQPREPQQSPREIPAGAYYVCQIPELPCRTEDAPRFSVPSARRPMIDQSENCGHETLFSFDRSAFFACQGDSQTSSVKAYGEAQGINGGVPICTLFFALGSAWRLPRPVRTNVRDWRLVRQRR